MQPYDEFANMGISIYILNNKSYKKYITTNRIIIIFCIFKQ